MDSRRGLPADLLVGATVPRADTEALAEALAACGVAPVTKVVTARRAAEQVQWLVFLALPLQAFLSVVGEKAAQDAYAAVRAAVDRLLRRSPDPALPGARTMVLADDDTGLQIVLSADLPFEAYRRLLEINLSDFKLGPLHYDRHTQRWRSIADEIAGQ
jgi:hypothetical protein